MEDKYNLEPVIKSIAEESGEDLEPEGINYIIEQTEAAVMASFANNELNSSGEDRRDRLMELHEKIQEFLYDIFEDDDDELVQDLAYHIMQKVADKHDLIPVIKSFANEKGLNVEPADNVHYFTD